MHEEMAFLQTFQNYLEFLKDIAICINLSILFNIYLGKQLWIQLFCIFWDGVNHTYAIALRNYVCEFSVQIISLRLLLLMWDY
jgi:hypothetical protein